MEEAVMTMETEVTATSGSVESAVETEATAGILTGGESPRLYAGKFKSIEDLEHGYKQSFPLYQKNQELEARLKKLTDVPEEYKIPDDISLRDTQLRELTMLSKRAGLNEDQFINAAKALNDNVSQQMNAFEERKQSMGEDKMNILKGFVEKNFSGFDDRFRETMFNQIIKDDKSMSDAMSQREQQLNSQVPGMSGTTGAPTKRDQMYDADRECQELGAKSLQMPNDKRAREMFIKKCKEVGHYKREG